MNFQCYQKPGEKYLKIGMMPTKGNLPKEFESIDLQEGDRILMLNGKRVKSIGDLRDVYEALAVADSVQFGIKRDDQMRIVSYLKPKDEMEGGGHMVGDVRLMADFLSRIESGADPAEDIQLAYHSGSVAFAAIESIETGGMIEIPSL